MVTKRIWSQYWPWFVTQALLAEHDREHYFLNFSECLRSTGEGRRFTDIWRTEGKGTYTDGDFLSKGLSMD